MDIVRLRCAECEVTVEGVFELTPLAKLSLADQAFVTAFMRVHGNIKKMEALFGISYPTVKNRLNAIAADYACHMRDSGYFGHTDPHDGRGLAERIEATDYPFDSIGENLAAGIWTAPEIIDAWLASPAHRDVLLDPEFTSVGIAVRFGGDYGIYCVLIMSSREKSAASLDAERAEATR